MNDPNDIYRPYPDKQKISSLIQYKSKLYDLKYENP